MRINGFLLLTAGLLLAADANRQDASSQSDLDRLQGTWSTVSIVSDGKTVMHEKDPPRPGPATKVAYEGRKWIVKVGDKSVASGVIKVDSTKTPKELDVMDESGVINAKSKLAIFELEGDTYKYCIALAGKARPTEFASKKGSGHTLIVSKRDKP